MPVVTRSQLDSLILRPGMLRSEMEKVVSSTAFDIERAVKEAMLLPKHGRTYRRGRITKAFSKRLSKGLRTYQTAKGNTRAIVGYKFHRASAPGEAPASDTGSTINSILTKPSGLRATIMASGLFELLEEKKNRPAFTLAVEKIRPGFLIKVDEAIGRLC